MIRPSDPDLLSGVAASLENSVLPELARGTAARRQLQAAIAILRRMAFAMPRRDDAIAADIADMSETLARMGQLVGVLPDETAARHLALQAAVAALADIRDDAVQTALTDLYRRMTERQLALIPPPSPRRKPGAPA